MACGKRAGAFTCLLDETGRYAAPEYAAVEDAPKEEVFPSVAATMLGPFPNLVLQILPYGCPAGQSL